MSRAEATEVLGPKHSALDLSEQAEGWPAVIGLAAAAERAEAVVPHGTVPGALHRYLAEELFHRASPELREELLALALRGTRQDASLDLTFGVRAPSLLAEAELLDSTRARPTSSFIRCLGTSCSKSCWLDPTLLIE